MTMLNEDELYHFGVKGMKWGVRNKKSREAKKTKKAQKKWDKNARKHWAEGYNKAVDYSNENFIDKLNEKYKDYDFSDRTNKNTQKVYKRYIEEYVNGFNSILERTIVKFSAIVLMIRELLEIFLFIMMPMNSTNRG